MYIARPHGVCVCFHIFHALEDIYDIARTENTGNANRSCRAFDGYETVAICQSLGVDICNCLIVIFGGQAVRPEGFTRMEAMAEALMVLRVLSRKGVWMVI